MGVMRFTVHPPDHITPEIASRAYVTGPDQFLWQSRCRLSKGALEIERAIDDSGYFHLPYPVAGRGELTLRTGWLMERERPYHLQVELARGKINQVRNQLAEWRAVGLSPTDVLLAKLRTAQEQFGRAATKQQQPDEAARWAEQAISSAVEAAELLGACYVKQALTARTRYAPKLDSQLGVRLGDSPPGEIIGRSLTQACNVVSVPINWRLIEASEGSFDWSVTDQQIQWRARHGLQAYGGPLLSFDDLSLPDWLCLWEGDFDNLISCVAEFVQTVVRRYRGQIALWNCAARVNGNDVLKLSQEDKLRIAVKAVEITRKIDPQTPVILSFDQPWAEYMRQEDVDPPLYLADTLIRAGLGLSGVGLEINYGYQPRGSYIRDMLGISQLLDHWSLLGVPLYLFVTLPSSGDEDAVARGPAKPLATPCPGGWSDEFQRKWCKSYLPLMLAKPTVRGVIYNQLHDSEPHAFPNGGLFNYEGDPKPALAALAALRSKRLK